MDGVHKIAFRLEQETKGKKNRRLNVKEYGVELLVVGKNKITLTWLPNGSGGEEGPEEK